MDGAGRWAATCSVLPGDSWELLSCSGALFSFSLLQNPPSHASVGQLLDILYIWGELRLGSGVGKGGRAKDDGNLESPGKKAP